MSSVAYRSNQDAQKQRALLADPIAFGEEMYGRIACGPFSAILVGGVPDATETVNGELLALVQDVAGAGDLATLREAVRYLPDMFTNVGCTAHAQGITLGAIFERLRRDLVDYLASMDRQERDHFEARTGESIAELRVATRPPGETSAADDAAVSTAVAEAVDALLATAAGRQSRQRHEHHERMM